MKYSGPITTPAITVCPFLEDELSKKHVCGQGSNAFGSSIDAGRLPEPEEFPAHNGPQKTRLLSV